MKIIVKRKNGCGVSDVVVAGIHENSGKEKKWLRSDGVTGSASFDNYPN